jgi:Glycosyl hydrolase family 76
MGAQDTPGRGAGGTSTAPRSAWPGVRALVVALSLALAWALAASALAAKRPPSRARAASEPTGIESPPAGEAPPSAPTLPYLQLAEAGVARAERTWHDRRLGWYDERLNDHERYPLATIWGIVPLFETIDAIDIAAPSSAHRATVAAFASGAERYFNASLRPTGGFAPYPNDRGQVRTWFDDNGWWGLAFMDAYRATGAARYLRDAERAFAFIAARGWDPRGGGLWWNTSHPYKAGEALASGSLLGALLFEHTHNQFYLRQVDKFLTWADGHFLTELRLYDLTDSNPTPTPYVEGPLVEAHQILCQAGQRTACTRARELADASWQRFEARLEMGPQFDTIYLHWMLVYATQTGDARWPALAREMAARAHSNALDSRGLYLRAWDGSSITHHEAEPNMIQTDAATLELFAWLSATHA